MRSTPARLQRAERVVFDDESNAVMERLTAYARSSDDPNRVAAD